MVLIPTIEEEGWVVYPFQPVGIVEVGLNVLSDVSAILHDNGLDLIFGVGYE